MARVVYGTATVLLCWLLMQAVHEAGHVLAGWWVGDRVERLVLNPLTTSRTDLSPGRNVLATTAAGPVFGAMVPALVSVIASLSKLPGRAWLRFFAGFCLIANGAYLGIALFNPVGDAEVLLREQAPLWWLTLFGGITVPAGLLLWHQLGREFGWGANAKAISVCRATTVSVILMLVITIELAISTNL
jgi:hypothetical protein